VDSVATRLLLAGDVVVSIGETMVSIVDVGESGSTIAALVTACVVGVTWTGARLQAVKNTRNRIIINRCMVHFSLTLI
jgi:hypothetical protein